MVVWALCDRFGHLQSPQWGSVLERRGEDYSRLSQSSGAPGCHNNSLCFVNYHYRVIIITGINKQKTSGEHGILYCEEKVEEILNKVSGVMNIKVKHRDDQLYNFLISQPGGSQYHQPPPDK